MAYADISPLKDVGLRMVRATAPTWTIKIYKPDGYGEDITNWALTFQASPSLNDNPVDIEKTIGSGITVVTAVATDPEDPAVVQVMLDVADTSGYPNVDTVLRFELTASAPGMPNSVISKGTLTIEPSFD